MFVVFWVVLLPWRLVVVALLPRSGFVVVPCFRDFFALALEATSDTRYVS